MKSETKNLNVDPSNARNEDYKKAMDEIITTNDCPLCPPMKWHPNPIIRDNGLWLLTKNGFPYKDTEHHLLLISKRHIEELAEITDEEAQSVFSLAKWATREFNIKGGGLTMRFGDTLYTGATVKHLHAHLIVPELSKEITGDKAKVIPVYFPIG